MNTQAPLFTENALGAEIEDQLAEMYCRLYALAAEDFTSLPDVQNYIMALTEWQRGLQQQLTKLMQVLSTHTHIIPPHTHPETPHTHICANPGSPSSPQIGSYLTGPTPLTTNVPVESATIKWVQVPPPSYVNTTLATPNMEGNFVIQGPSMKGPLTVGPRRMKVPTVLMKPTMLPIVKEML